MPEPSVSSDFRSDLITIAAIAIVVYAAASVIHEAIGHGGACLLVGCKPQFITSMQFIGDESRLSQAAIRFVSAGGSLANLAAAAIATWFFKRQRSSSGAAWFFLWLFVTLNLLQATGYLLYSGVFDFGDWANVTKGFRPIWLWRVALILVGACSYWLTVKWAMRKLAQHLRAQGDARVAEANRYSLVAYLAGGVVSVAAGLFEPGGAMLVLISGAAAALGGASGLAWGPQMLHDPRLGAERLSPLEIRRSWPWIIAGTLVALGFVFVLGRGIKLP